jgi:hypothetical protein
MRLQNVLAAFEGKAAAVGVASVGTETLSLMPEERMVERTIKVDPEAKRLTVRIRSSDPAADLDLHLFDCTQGRCERRESVVFRSGEKELTVANPAAGEWRAVVTAHALPPGGARVEYAEAVVVPKYGELTVTDTASRRATEATWAAEVKIAGGEAVPDKRARMAVVDVVSETAQTPVGSFWGQPGPDTPLGPSVFGTVWLPLR